MKNFNRIAGLSFLGFAALGAFACSDAGTDNGGIAGSGSGATAGKVGTAGMGPSTAGSNSSAAGSPTLPSIGGGGSGAAPGGDAGVGGTGGNSSGGTAGGATSGGSSTGGKGSKGGSGGTTGSAGTAGSAGSVSSGGSGGGTTGGSTKGCGATTWPKSKDNNTIMVNGKSRVYNLKVPDNYDPKKPYRLIFSFHWLNGTAKDVSGGSGTAKAWYGLWDLAQGSTIFVAPQGINNGWSDNGHTNSKGGDDIDFTKTLLTELEDTLCIDTSRIFAEGFSMGGSMSYAVACAMGDLFRGVAVHSGGPMSGCVTPHTKPVAYFMTHGTNDSVCKYPGFGVPQLQDFAKVNGCMMATLPTPTSSASACVDFTGCTMGYPTRSCLFVGDHTPSPGGTSNSWVPAETWKFISQF